MASEKDERIPENRAGMRRRAERLYEEYRALSDSGDPLSQDEFVSRFPDIEEDLSRIFRAAKAGKTDRAETSSHPHTIGEFRIIRELGRGGMGTVFEAEQVPLKRRVALKVLPAHLSFSGDSVLKFRREAEAGGRQSHPGIVAVYSVGEREGFHYIAQELVEGGKTLADRLDDARQKAEQPTGYFRKASQIIMEVARALQHAHDSGVVHRDVKPSNILITSSGRAKVTDFGLARVEDALALSRTGDFAGTPYYMSPEQAMSRRIGIDNRTDIYSLGVTLYEMLTLKRPFEGETTHDVLKKIILVDPEDPHRSNPRVPRDLAVICLKAMEKLPERRYGNMQDFADELGRFLSGDAILARPLGLGSRLCRMARRNPVKSVAAAIALAALLAFATVVPWVKSQVKEEANRELAKKNDELERANREIRRLADRKRLAALENRARDLWPAGPEIIEKLEEWIADAVELKRQRDLHEEMLETLRQSAKPYTSQARIRDRESHPQWETLLGNRQKRDRLRESLALIEADGGDGSPGPPAETVGKRQPIGKPEDLKKMLADVEAAIADLEMEISQQRTYEFESDWEGLRHVVLKELVDGIKRLDEKDGALTSVQKRLQFARSVREESIEKHQDAWDRAIASIADRYEGLLLEPMLGFVPLGRDNESGLWEFAHLQTGLIPVRGLDGKLIPTEETGLVFVLIPGGVFVMGTEPPSGDEGDLAARVKANEQPAHTVTVRPFLLSKYEMTQGQWLRSTGRNPSEFNPDIAIDGEELTLRHPVENVSWSDCTTILGRLRLRLPSESEWEYAARAGTTTPWWTGDRPESLEGAVNICDRYCNEHGDHPDWQYEDWNDGYLLHAPVGRFRPNKFGLHDILGNVYEWCEDLWHPDYVGAPSDGSPWKGMGPPFRIIRGGCWMFEARNCRSGMRVRFVSSTQLNIIGVRPALSLSR